MNKQNLNVCDSEQKICDNKVSLVTDFVDVMMTR